MSKYLDLENVRAFECATDKQWERLVDVFRDAGATMREAHKEAAKIILRRALKHQEEHIFTSGETEMSAIINYWRNLSEANNVNIVNFKNNQGNLPI